MDFGATRKYEIELWSASGQRVADISALCSNRSFTVERNQAEIISFDLNLFEFEAYCLNALGGIDPKTILRAYTTDVKVKRDGAYWIGGQVVDVNFSLMEPSNTLGTAVNESSSYSVTITANGYLNFLNDRVTSNTYSQWDRSDIVVDLINTTQAMTNGSFGINVVSGYYKTGVPTDETYKRDNIKTAIQTLCNLADAPFDFYFDYAKNFYLVQQQGALRKDISLVYGGDAGNVTAFQLDQSGLNVYNEIIGLGYGFGAAQLVSVKDDVTSQGDYYLRQRVSQFNTVTDQATLDVNTQGDLNLYKELLELPTVTITSNELPAQFLSVGDRVLLKVLGHTWLSDINGLYRIEKLVVKPDEQDFEMIDITFDGYQVSS